jgi:hypothetical protein
MQLKRKSPRAIGRLRGWRVSTPQVVVATVLVVGLAGTVVALQARQSDTQFVYAQRNLATVTPEQLSTLLKTSHDARPRHGDAPATSARCVAAPEPGRLWSCSVRYPAGPPVVYRVTVAPSGIVTGVSAAGLVFRGCCVNPGGSR